MSELFKVGREAGGHLTVRPLAPDDWQLQRQPVAWGLPECCEPLRQRWQSAMLLVVRNVLEERWRAGCAQTGCLPVCLSKSGSLGAHAIHTHQYLSTHQISELCQATESRRQHAAQCGAINDVQAPQAAKGSGHL